MNVLVTALFLVLWIVVGFVVLRIIGQRYFHEPRRADVAALAVAIAFALGVMWPYSARHGAAPTGPTAPPEPAQIQAAVLGIHAPAGTHEVSAACRSVRGELPANGSGAFDALRSDAATSDIVPTGGLMDRTQRYLIQGWATTAGGIGPALGVCLAVDGAVQPKARAFYGAPRPDVAQALHQDGATMSGYEIIIPEQLLPPGRHRIEVVVHSGPGRFAILPANRDVTIR